MRFGFGDVDAKPQTLRQVGKNMGVTKERVRQIEMRALEKMRRIAEEENLEIPEFY
jgi:DNA-directed RNA polymerase sigma subunit (sigma70/sigma32)